MRYVALCAFVFLLTAGLASAGTVKLTGACGFPQLNGTSMIFSLSNSGNDTAYNLVLTPIAVGAQASNGSYSISSLSPGSNATEEINFTNITEKGTHVVYVETAYDQGNEVFAAVFPCTAPLLTATTSQLFMTANSESFSNGTSMVKVNVINAGSASISANVSLALPLSLTYAGSGNFAVDLAPYQTSNVTFDLVSRLPLGSVSYAAAAFATYSQDNLSYASLRQFILTPSASSAAAPSSISLVTVAFASAVAVVVALILLSLRKRRHSANPVS